MMVPTLVFFDAFLVVLPKFLIFAHDIQDECHYE